MKQPDSQPSDSPDAATSYACVTVDLDGLGCYRDIHGLPARDADIDPAYSVGVRRLLDLFARHDIRTTLFVIGRDTRTPAHAELLEEAHRAGHELGNHTFAHDYALPNRSSTDIEDDIARGEDAIAEISGARPVGYRAPGYNITDEIYGIVRERAYLYDSSVFPCPPYYLAKAGIMGARALMGQPSRSAMTPARNLLAPIRPYVASEQHVWRRSSDGNGLVEIPMALIPALRFPVIGTSLHLLGRAGFDALYPILRRTYPELLQLEFHAIDFMDATDEGAQDLVDAQPDLRVPWGKKRALYDHIFTRLTSDYAAAEPLEQAVRALY